jgi:pyrroline-5-carboxylate reductase
VSWPESIGVIGCGAMGRAMSAGLVRARPEAAGTILLADALPEAAEQAARETGGRIAALSDAAAADLVILAVKPKDVEVALEGARDTFGADSVLLSVVAGWTLDRLSVAAPGVALARTMPNLAVRHGSGVVILATRGVSDGAQTGLEDLLRCLGTVVVLPESLFAAATGLAGCGPGFLALVAEGLEEGAVATGLARPQARAIVQALLAGTAALLGGDADPAELRQRVSSPGGATIEGIGVLERGAVRAHLADAVKAAARRTAEI